MTSWTGSGPWSREQIDAHLSALCVPVRLGCLDSDGVPRVVSLWFEWRDGAIYCATQGDAAVVRWLSNAPAVGFEVAADAPPYRGVRGIGEARIERAGADTQLERLLDRYEIAAESSLRTNLLRRSDSEVAIRIEPTRIDSWDYSERMADAK